ncbi:glycosyltransferase family 4 protein [Demequina salsinemoris]|uniref:glycosyltransferase family 4 protein n=1 Tax=Demequina salsinemoris TaxID=577470 RepID=UPI001364DCCA|nr:glycosyltransferase family 1 protein [Demequina salsinemoris]
MFDAYWLADGPPSGRNVVSSLIAAWASEFKADDLTALLPADVEIDLPSTVSRIVVRPFVPNHGLWVQTQLGKASAHSDVLITQNFAPLLRQEGRLSVVFMHDAIYRRHPEWFQWRERRYLDVATASLRQADLIWTSSEAEASQIRGLLPRYGERVVPIGLAVPRGLATAVAIRPGGHTAEPFVLAVGRLNVRKNVGRLIEAVTPLLASGRRRLLIVGTPDGMEFLQEEHENVHFMGGVSDGELRWLYENCEAFVFPSLDEGFGLPLYEAKFFGAPVAASAIPPFLEGNLADNYFDPTSTGSLRSSVTELLERRVTASSADAGLADWSSIARRARASVLRGGERS